MKRRNFLILGSILGISPYLQAKSTNSTSKEFNQLRATFEAVQEHLFPSGNLIPSAKAMKLTEFLYSTISHQSFDRDIRAFILKGAKKLDKRTKGKFTTMSYEQKERTLREYEKTRFGGNWLGRIVTLSMEGLFGDPIYGSNIGEAGWKSIDTYGGNPRPTTKYLGV